MSKPSPIRIWRDPTRMDVEELCHENYMVLQVKVVPGGREFIADHAFGPEQVHLGTVAVGERPDWRAMLQKLGSDWA